MKGGMLYFGISTAIMLVVVIVAMYVSGGFELIQESFGLAGVVGFIILFTLISVGFMAMVRNSLKSAMEQGGQKGSSAQYDERDVERD